ncbi:MFS transporter [Halostella sp. JP-L12]|uniref:MFS transporter n=1 Tax=Halostella TaxID=1843185 RepID=UPI000EF76685|nr:MULTISPECIES: MFS transporter [Halostella]NHN49056.1 MFS transporter [Halostella sp. JP-L12]
MTGDRWLYGWGTGYAAVGAASLLVPLYALEQGADALLVGLMASTAAFAGVPGAIIWGRLASRTGRRRVFVATALAATAVVLAAIPFLRSPFALLLANAALWFVVAAAAPVLSLIVVDGVPEAEWERVLGRLNHYQGYGWLLGLLAGALWTGAAGTRTDAVTAQRQFFLLSAAAALLGLAVVAYWYPEKSTVSERRFARVYRKFARTTGRTFRAVPFGPGRVYWSLRSFDRRRLSGRLRSGLGAYLVALTLCFVGFSTFFGPLPAYLAEESFSTGEVFALFVLSSAGSAAFYARAGALSTRYDPRRLQTVALVARAGAFPAVGLVGLALVPPAALAVQSPLFAIVGVTWAIIAVTAAGLVTRLAPATARGDALGAYAALSSLGGGVGSALGGWAATAHGYVFTFGAAAALVAVGAVLVALAPGTATSPLGSPTED